MTFFALPKIVCYQSLLRKIPFLAGTGFEIAVPARLVPESEPYRRFRQKLGLESESDLWDHFCQCCQIIKFHFVFRQRNLPDDFQSMDVFSQKADTINLFAEMLISYEETPDAPVNEKTCAYFERAELDFVPNNNPICTGRLGFCTNIREFVISFHKRPASLQELSFFSKTT